MTILQVSCRQCLDSHGAVDRRVMRWVKTIGSYAELDYDINGIRILVEGDLPRDMTAAFDSLDTGWSIARLYPLARRSMERNRFWTCQYLSSTGQSGINQLVKALTAGRSLPECQIHLSRMARTPRTGRPRISMLALQHPSQRWNTRA